MKNKKPSRAWTLTEIDGKRSFKVHDDMIEAAKSKKKFNHGGIVKGPISPDFAPTLPDPTHSNFTTETIEKIKETLGNYNGHGKFYILPGLRRPFKYKGFDVFLGWKAINDKFVWMVVLEKQFIGVMYRKGFVIVPKRRLSVWRDAAKHCMNLIDIRIKQERLW